MKKLIITLLIICLYSFPYVYFAMYQDFANASMIGYIVMIFGTSLLAFASKYVSNFIPFIIGNLASAATSFYFLYKMSVTYGVGWYEGYFKPLTPYQLFLLVSLLNVIPQLLFIKLAKKIKKPRNIDFFNISRLFMLRFCKAKKLTRIKLNDERFCDFSR